jgi:uncharacterized RDD family membrane protein YckC
METTLDAPPRLVARPAHLGWRLLALVYDSLPMIPLLMIVSAAFLWLNGGRTIEHAPLMQWGETIVLFGLVGSYFVFSWRRGGQTMGMRPWRLKLLAADGTPATLKSLWLRYVVACATPVLCLLWTLVDKDRRGLHDLAAGTIFVRMEASPLRR